LTAGRLESAVKDFKQAVKIDATLADAYYYMAEAYYKNNQSAQAKEALVHCLEIDPTNKKAITLRDTLAQSDLKTAGTAPPK
jgi:tetratricopeptide (TPR) repeat protein